MKLKTISLVCFSCLFTSLQSNTFALPRSVVLAPIKDGGGGGSTALSIDVSPSAELVRKIESGTLTKPKRLVDLNRIDNSTQVYSVDQAVKLGFSFGSVDQKYNRRFYVKNFVQYKEFQDGDVRVWYGVGIRWVINVRIIDANAKISGVPFVAAAADYKTVEASAQFQVIGLTNPKITQLAQSVPGELNLETYGSMYSVFTRITELMSASDTVVAPEIVARVVKDPETEQGYGVALVQMWALQTIANGKSLYDAQESFPSATAVDKEIIKNVYVFIVGSDELHSKPKQRSIGQATEILRGIKVKK